MPNTRSSFIEIRIVQLDFEFNVLDPMSPSPVTITSRRLEIPPLPEDDPTITLMSLIEGISVCENILVATVARIIPGREISSRILIADTRMGSARWMCASSLQASTSHKTICSLLLIYHSLCCFPKVDYTIVISLFWVTSGRTSLFVFMKCLDSLQAAYTRMGTRKEVPKKYTRLNGAQSSSNINTHWVVARWTQYIYPMSSQLLSRS